MIKNVPRTLFFVLLISTQASAQYKSEMTVAQDGSGDYTLIQDAIDASKSFPDERITIYIKNGVYHEKLKVHSWSTKLTFIGEDKGKTIIRFDDYFDKINRGRNSTFFTYTMLVQGNDFHAENLTIENTAGPVGQAVALHVEADRCSFVNCRLIGNQDTHYAAGENARQYYKNCYIEGTTDFVFGQATAVFEECEIRSKSNSYITAASTEKDSRHGFVFIECRLTAESGVDKVYLGRPWRTHAQTVFVNCELGPHIIPVGWHNWSNEEAEKKAFYAEYQSKGPGANPKQRVSWSKQLTEKEAEKYTAENILGSWIKERL